MKTKRVKKVKVNEGSSSNKNFKSGRKFVYLEDVSIGEVVHKAEDIFDLDNYIEPRILENEKNRKERLAEFVYDRLVEEAVSVKECVKRSVQFLHDDGITGVMDIMLILVLIGDLNYRYRYVEKLSERTKVIEDFLKQYYKIILNGTVLDLDKFKENFARTLDNKDDRNETIVDSIKELYKRRGFSGEELEKKVVEGLKKRNLRRVTWD